MIFLKSAGFGLAKWHSNAPFSHDGDADSYGITNTKILGLLWQPTVDVDKATCNSVPEVTTKRNMLSIITHIYPFDRMGLIGLVTIKAKILLRSLWQLKIEWDTPLSESLRIL